MIHDLDADPRDIDGYDVCIVGTGPAGATLANELAGAGLRLCMLESGKRKPTRYGDRMRRVVSEGIHIKDYSRERTLGGASTTWAGLSSPFDPVDFEPREYVPHSGWPIGLTELAPYYARAAERYRFPPLAFFEAGGFGALRGKGAVQPEWRRIEEKVFLAAAEPQDFGRELADLLEGDAVDVFLDATLVELRTDDGGARVTEGRVRTSTGREVRVRAKRFVLATGGIENARLLLASGGLGNARDQVGRFFMNHPKNYYGILKLDRPLAELPYYFGCLYQGYAGYAGLRLKPEEQAARGLLNSYVRFEPLFPWSDNPGIESLVLLVKRTRFLLKGFRARHEDDVVSLRDYSETGDDSDLQNERKSLGGWLGLFGRILLHLPRVLQYLYFRLVPGAVPKIRRVRLRNFLEMEPSPENRVTLADEADEHGVPLPRVVHSCSEADREALIQLHATLAQELRDTGIGTLTGDLRAEPEWPITQDASHHMGTTRMGADPATSVVDPDCRVHGVQNLYVAGASVFPTSGCANPTFTLVALAIRLAEHLRTERP